MTWFRWDGADLVLHVQVQPGARLSAFVGLHGERIKISIHAAPVDGRANAELQAFLCSSFNVNKNAVQIEQGESARAKSARIQAPRMLPATLLKLGLAKPACQ
jgi:uncharacterized protein (TIGR00251 family)